MNMRTCYTILAAGAAVALTGTAALAGVEKKIELTDVPAKVMEVAKAGLADLKLASAATVSMKTDTAIDDNIDQVYENLGEVTLVSANTETEDDGSSVYEIQGTVGNGRKVEIDITPDGEIEEIEIEFRPEDVPGAVMKAIAAKLPGGFKPTFIEASHSASMQVTGYEFVGTMGGKQMDIEVSADGRRIEVADQ